MDDVTRGRFSRSAASGHRGTGAFENRVGGSDLCRGGTGHGWLVPAMAKAAIAAGADGIMVEVHNKPLEALSDGQQSLYPEQFVQMVKDIDKIAQAMGRRLFLHKSLLT